MFKTRLISGIILVIIALATIISGSWILFFTLLAVSLIGMRELYKVMKVSDEHVTVLELVGYLGAVLYYIAMRFDFGSYGTMAIIISMILILFVYVFGYPKYRAEQVMAAFFGMATKYAEGMLAVKYRVIAEDGLALGGPFYYIEKGMGKNFKWLAKLFCIFGTMVGLFGIGTFTQVNGITSAVNNFFDSSNVHTISLFGMNYSISVVVAGIIVTVCAGLVIIGGIKRISKVSEIIVPFMAVTYIGVCLLIVLTHLPQVPVAFGQIIQSAFGLKAAAGGAIGAMTVAMQKGIARGIFSNEAGLGSAPIAAAAAQTNEPVRQGLVSMTGTFIDTIIVCTMTGLAIVMTGAWDMGLEGVAVTTKAFALGLPFPAKVSAFILMMCLVFFAFTTILGWAYYSERCLEYLVNGKKFVITVFKWLYILAVFIGPFMTVSAVWTIADICNGLMAFPNLVALLALNGDVVSETRGYLERVGIVKTTVGEA